MTSRDASRPNIVVVQTDDQGAWAMPHCNDDLIAPHFRALIDSGTRFDNFYCASPVCSPARASLLTGRMPSAHGVHDWVRGAAYGVPDADGFLDSLVTTPALLAEAGWVCGHAGKWHLGNSREPAEGFKHWYAHRTGDGPYFGAPVWRDGQPHSETRYLTEAITEEALGFLATSNDLDAPFYLEVNYTAPHSPWVDQHPPAYTQPYEDCAFGSVPREPVHPWFNWEPGPVSNAMRDPMPSLIGYFAALTAVDAGVGRLLRALEERGLRDTTCIVFTSDNGFSCGHHGVWGKGNATWPLNMWEPSTKVPFVMSMPGVIGEGVTDSGLAGACDLHPTLLELAGLTPQDEFAAGCSLLGRLRGESGPAREATFVCDEYGGTRMIRSDRWKYILRSGDAPKEFYDLDRDPFEQHNLVDDPIVATVRRELHDALTTWFRLHTHPALDAFHRPVSGRGQLLPLHSDEPDEHVYYAGTAERRISGTSAD